MNRFLRVASRHFCCAALMLAGAITEVRATGFADPLDTPSLTSALAPHALLNGVAQAGRRVVAVGQRGHIVYSDDLGASWHQARVPVSVDLVAVKFVSDSEGWAVGHDSVVLHSGDGGATWERQFDGRKDAAAGDKPLLDIWFDNAGHGLAVGAFGLLLRSDDAGKSWQHWEGAADNPKALHLNAIRAVGADVYIVGEQGLILKRSADGQRFTACDSGYRGSYFGLTGGAGKLVVFGLRGTAMHSNDGGASWQRSATGIQTALNAGLTLDDGTVLLVSQGGQILRSRDGGASFQLLPQAGSGPASAALMLAKGRLLIAGVRGVRVQPIAEAQNN